MPVHDWTRVGPGIFHDFHNAWLTELRTALNTGILPSDYYALSEQVAGQTGPDVLTLQVRPSNGSPRSETTSGGLCTVTTKPPRVRLVQRLEDAIYAGKRKTLVIHHSSDDRVVAILEILSAGNKASLPEFNRFLDKAISALTQGIHLTIVDLFPPGKRDPNGVHAAILAECSTVSYQPPPEKPLTLVSYAVGPVTTAYVEPIAVGDTLPDMPLFLSTECYVGVPLEATYEAAYRGVPARWRDTLETSWSWA